MESIKYRCFWTGSRKADAIMSSRQEVERVHPMSKAIVVKVFRGRELMTEYLVSWMGDHFKWDACHSIDD